MLRERLKVLFAIIFSFGAIWWLSFGCGGGECKFDGDCSKGKVCEGGQCIPSKQLIDSGSSVEKIDTLPDESTPIDEGECEDGHTRECYTGPENTKGKGECRAGVQECVNGKWGDCKEEVLPGDEKCNGKDDDCDGQTDEGCACKPGDTRDCYGGPDKTAGVGICKKGVQKCDNNGQWGKCEGELRPSQEECNGQDDDCNGKIDDNIPSPPPCENQKGVCSKTYKKCGGKQGWLPCTPEQLRASVKNYEKEEKSCDGLDNDCDGQVDENLSQPCFTGNAGCKVQSDGTYKCQGICKAGFKTCSGGTWSNCVGQILPQPESCNGKDDNCDGKVDENCQCKPGDTQICYNGPAGTAGKGICKKGRQVCQADGKWGPCSGEVLPEKEKCNGKDDDCNGKIDDNLTGPPCEKEFGVCAGMQKKCGGIQGWLPCTEAQYKANSTFYQKDETLCDNKDNDCDGSVDEGLSKDCYPSSSGCKQDSSGKYKCEGPCKPGKSYCQNGKWGNCISPVLPEKEKCNGKDDDCNGKIDDNIFTNSDTCTVPNQKGICKEGRKSCKNGQIICQQINQPKKEICTNNKDDDCNGKIDDCAVCQAGQTKQCYNSSQGCTKNGNSYSCKGICKAGLQKCINGQWGPCTDQKIPAKEICNWLDDDCDGLTDEDGVCLYYRWSLLPAPTGDIKSYSFINHKIGFAVGVGGKIWRTSDGGKSWTPAKSPTTKTLYSVATLPNGLVLAAGEGGTIVRSVDSGYNFSTVQSGTTAQLYKVRVNSDRNAVISGRSGVVLLSSDGGATWKKSRTPTRKSLYSITIFSKNKIVAVGSSGYAIYSSDFGNTWKTVTTGVSTRLNDIATSGSTLLAVGDKGTVIRSTDGGINWKTISSGVKHNLSAVVSPGKDVFVIAGYADKFLLSIDGGKSFAIRSYSTNNNYIGLAVRAPTEVIAYGGGKLTLGRGLFSLYQYQLPGTLYGVTFDNGTIGDNTALAVGTVQAILRKKDQKDSWYPIFLPIKISWSSRLRAVTLYGKNAVAVGSKGLILYSTDQGNSWKKANSPTTKDLYGVSIFNSIALAVGSSGTLLRSTDGGKNWKALKAPSPPSSYSTLYSVSIKDKTAVAVGSSGWIIESNDAGQTWTRVSTGLTTKSLYDVNQYYISSVSSKIAVGGSFTSSTIAYWHTIDTNKTWRALNFTNLKERINGIGIHGSGAVAVGNNGTVLYSTNRQNRWFFFKNFPGFDYFDSFRAYLNGPLYLIVGEDGIIFQSKSPVTTWSLTRIPSSSIYSAIALSTTEFIAFGYNGLILQSTDGGETWNIIHTPTKDTLQGSAVSPNGTIIAVGSNRAIIRSTDKKTFKAISSKPSGTFTLYSVASPLNNTFVAVGSFGTIIRSTDDGINFVKVNASTSSSLYKIKCKGLFCIAVGSSGTVLTSIDGGNSFTKRNLGTTKTIGTVAIGSSKRAVVGARYSGDIYYTEDGGATWKRAKSPTSSSIYALTALSDLRYILFDLNGQAFGSGDGGKSWFLLSPPNYTYIRDFSVNGSVGIAVGSRALILKYD